MFFKEDCIRLLDWWRISPITFLRDSWLKFGEVVLLELVENVVFLPRRVTEIYQLFLDLFKTQWCLEEKMRQEHNVQQLFSKLSKHILTVSNIGWILIVELNIYMVFKIDFSFIFLHKNISLFILKLNITLHKDLVMTSE